MNGTQPTGGGGGRPEQSRAEARVGERDGSSRKERGVCQVGPRLSKDENRRRAGCLDQITLRRPLDVTLRTLF